MTLALNHPAAVDTVRNGRAAPAAGAGLPQFRPSSSILDVPLEPVAQPWGWQPTTVGVARSSGRSRRRFKNTIDEAGLQRVDQLLRLASPARLPQPSHCLPRRDWEPIARPGSAP
jgi:hypothetical protein